MAIKEWYEVEEPNSNSDTPNPPNTLIFDTPLDAHVKATALSARSQQPVKIVKCVLFTGHKVPTRTTLMSVTAPAWVTEEFLTNPGDPIHFSQTSNNIRDPDKYDPYDPMRHAPKPRQQTQPKPYATPGHPSYPSPPPVLPMDTYDPGHTSKPHGTNLRPWAQNRHQAHPVIPQDSSSPLNRPFKPCFTCGRK